jgi:hypothetical protein
MATAPERIEGPTPAGGVYAIAYRGEDGSIEIVEYDQAGAELMRTYCEPRRPPAPPGGGDRRCGTVGP